VFTTPQVNLYSSDVERTAAFYSHLGFVESFRTPIHAAADHVELKLEGLTLGVGSAAAGIREHGLDIRLDERGRGAEVVLWTHDVDAAFLLAVRHGAQVLLDPHDVRGLRIAYVLDPDDNPVKFVQHRDRSHPSPAPHTG
jgi:catechol 2,3-dioxygenase-like lactoylglutathione lyase family enzyme